MARKTYKLNRPLQMESQRYEVGETVELDEGDAKTLLERGVLEESGGTPKGKAAVDTNERARPVDAVEPAPRRGRVAKNED